MKTLLFSAVLFPLFLLFLSGCVVQPPQEEPAVQNSRADIDPFGNLTELLTITNPYGISGAAISNFTSGMETQAGSGTEPVVTVKLLGSVEGPGTNEIDEMIAAGNDPYTRELTGGFIRYSLGKSAVRDRHSNASPDDWKRLIEKGFRDLRSGKINRAPFRRQEIEKVLDDSRRKFLITLLSNTVTVMSNRYYRLRNDYTEYSGMISNGYRRDELERSLYESLDGIDRKFRSRGVTNLKTAEGDGKSSVADRQKFHDYFLRNAISGDICVYFDPGDFLIGGHAFLWNGSKKKVLTSGLGIPYGIGSASPGSSGCKYYDPDGSFPYLNHDEMWLLRPVKPYSVSTFEKQMDAFESVHRLSGYSVQPFVYDTSTGTYCSQVVFLNWKAFDGRYISSGAPLSWVPYYYYQHIYTKVSFMGVAYWQDCWVLQIGLHQVDTGFGIVTGNDILHDDGLQCVIECR